jgi:glycosyltransferase involved in cell wall biosynthesis
VTTPLRPGHTKAAFSHPGVKVRCVKINDSRPIRMLRFAQNLWSERRNLPRDSIEIAYDPIGILYSDLVPRRPRRRIAHLHELLSKTDGFLEGRLKRTIHRYDAIVVPDMDRAQLTQNTLSLRKPPIVVENYPLRASVRFASNKSGRFEVVYCGSLGRTQKLDTIISSIPFWPEDADLVLIGDNTTETAREMGALVLELGLSERVRFLGWMSTPAAEQRLAHANLGVALLTSNSEQWRTALGASNKRYQYMKAGLPQIGDTNPGVPNLLSGIGDWVDAQAHDPTEIARLVCAYADDPVRCAEEGGRAYRRHQDSYNYEHVFRRLQNLIETW